MTPSSSARTRFRAGIAVPLLALVAAACGAAPGSGTPAPSPTSGTPTPTPSSAAVLLRVTSEGGFINPVASLAAVPTIVVYTDGRMFSAGQPTGENPDPLVAPIAVRSVGAAGEAAIVAAVREAGLDKPASGGPGVAGDSGTLVFEASIDGATVTTRYAGNGPGPGGPGVGGDDPGRTAALALVDRLLDPAETWGAASAPAFTYEPTAFKIYAAPGAPPVDPSASEPPVAWPLTTTLATFGTPAVPDRGVSGLRVAVIGGADGAAIAPVLAAASSGTAFTSDGQPFTLYVRPLLPDEAGG